jgi:hypothetical protein
VPVYPIAVLSFVVPRTLQPHVYRVTFPNKTVLEFNYDIIQLNRLSWRVFVNEPNPIAAALMSKMNIAHRDRARVKWECLRLLTSLKLDKARLRLISGFVDTYLQLDAQEQADFDNRLKQTGPTETEEVMEIVTSWMREGIKQGRREGRKAGLKAGLKTGRNEGLKAGHKAGIDEGRLEASQDSVVEILMARFGRLPVGLKKTIKTIDRISRLKALLREAATTESVARFQQGLSSREQQDGKTHRSK